MKTIILVGICLSIAMLSCNKISDENTHVINEPNYCPMSVGSYWVYNTYEIDSMKNEVLKSENDTIKILGDTNIYGYQYKIFYGKPYGIFGSKKELYRRDSLGYIVDETGRIIFSPNNFTDTLFSESVPDNDDPTYFQFTKMKALNESVYLSLGEFDSVLNCELNFNYLANPNNMYLTMGHLYAPNVGCIIRQTTYVTKYFNEKAYYEDRLINYYIEK